MIIVDTVIEVEVDPTLRCGPGHQMTFSGFSDIRGGVVPEPGTMVLAVHAASDEATWAVVMAVNVPAMLVYLAVSWNNLRPRADFYMDAL